jgi:hypothetical protein
MCGTWSSRSKFELEKSKVRDHLGDTGVDVRIILK